MICGAAFIVAFGEGGVCVSDLWHRSHNGVCRGCVSVTDLCRRN